MLIKKSKNLYCSKKCHNIKKKEYMKGEGNHQFGLKGEKNASWKSDRKLSRYGYIQVRSLDHPFRDHQDMVFEHRLVAEKYLLNEENSVLINGKRYLKKEYVVHHKNFNRTDNRPSNLIVMTHKDHKRLHNSLNPVARGEKGMFIKDTPNMIKIKKTSQTAVMPERKTDGAAGFDLCADIEKEITINPHETVMINSGIAFEIPKNYYGAIFARSGISVKEGLRPATCVSIIDSDYRGSVGLPIHNDSGKTRVIHPQERIAQIVFCPALIVDLELVDELDETERGEGGFGSTGR